MSNDRVVKTYVWHGEECFFVSTVERDSSAIEGASRFNETLVWEFKWDKNERGRIIFQAEAPVGSIATHQRTVDAIHEVGRKAFE